MMTIKGDNGKSLKVVPDLLVVAPQNEAVARQILFPKLLQEVPMSIKILVSFWLCLSLQTIPTNGIYYALKEQ